MNNEVWLPVNGYEKYEVSNTGKVRSLDYRHTGETKELKQKTNREGYKTVRLFNNGEGKFLQVHRLVAQAFIKNPDNLPVINHIDENPQNNHVKNLEWCTQKYNNSYGGRRKRLSDTLSAVLPGVHGKPVMCVETGTAYMTIKECGLALGIDPSNISRVLNGEYKQAQGYTFVRR